MDGAGDLEQETIGKHEDRLLLDAARRRFGLKSDNALALKLGVSRNLISQVRSGAWGLGPRQRIKLLDWLPFIPNLNLEEALQIHNVIDVVHAVCLSKRPSALLPVCDHQENVLLDLCREAFDVPSDNQLAEYLGLSQSTIAMIRTKRLKAGLMTRLRIVSRVSNDAQFVSVERALSSTDYLIELLEQPALTQSLQRRFAAAAESSSQLSQYLSSQPAP